MTLFEWLLAKKPPNVSFFVKRNFIPGTEVESTEEEMKLMAKLILDMVKYHTDNNFVSDPIPPLTVQLGNVYLFDYEDCHFGLAGNGWEMAVGGMFHMPSKEK